jgi:site-specific DNA recombinase
VDLDRLHRQPVEIENFIVLADRHNLALATVTGDVDLSTGHGRQFAPIKGSVARAEVGRKSARQRRAGLQRAQDGKPWGPHRPSGFERDSVAHTPHEVEAIRAMYDYLIAGFSQHAIARGLNERGLMSTNGKPWVQTTVRNLLRVPRPLEYPQRSPGSP